MATTPKKPQDHKKPEEEVKVDTRPDGSVTAEIDGFTITLTQHLMKDYRFMQAMRDMETSPLAVIDVFERMVPDKTVRANIETHLTDKDGYLDIENVAKFIMQVLESAAPNS